MILLDIIKEYILIAYLKMLPFLKKLPDEWNLGEQGDVILIPGLHETNFFLYKIAKNINTLGYKIHVIPNFNSTNGIEQISHKLNDVVSIIESNEIILISHSKGGLVAKYFIDTSSQAKKIKYSISIATPYKGTLFGKLKFHGLHEVEPNSRFINCLSSTENNAKIINFYPKFDNHVIPNNNLTLEGANNIKINVNGHTRILTSVILQDEIVTLLGKKHKLEKY